MHLFGRRPLFNLFYNHHPCQKYSDVFCSLGRNSAQHLVQRPDDSGSLVTATADAFILFLSGVPPDYKFEVAGRRATMNGFELTLHVLANTDLLLRVQSLWESAILCVVGEGLDPAEIVNGLLLEDEKRKDRRGGIKDCEVFRLELWFSVRDDAVCLAVCDEFRAALEEVEGGSLSHSNSQWTKLSYFQTKHKVSL